MDQVVHINLPRKGLITKIRIKKSKDLFTQRNHKQSPDNQVHLLHETFHRKTNNPYRPLFEKPRKSQRTKLSNVLRHHNKHFPIFEPKEKLLLNLKHVLHLVLKTSLPVQPRSLRNLIKSRKEPCWNHRASCLPLRHADSQVSQRPIDQISSHGLSLQSDRRSLHQHRRNTIL